MFVSKVATALSVTAAEISVSEISTHVAEFFFTGDHAAQHAHEFYGFSSLFLRHYFGIVNVLPRPIPGTTVAPSTAVPPTFTPGPTSGAPPTPAPNPTTRRPIPPMDNIVFTARFTKVFNKDTFVGKLETALGISASQVSVVELSPHTVQFQFRGKDDASIAHNFYNLPAVFIQEEFGIDELVVQPLTPQPTAVPTTLAPPTPPPTAAPPNTTLMPPPPLTMGPANQTASPPTTLTPVTTAAPPPPIPANENILFTVEFRAFDRKAFERELLLRFNVAEGEVDIESLPNNQVRFRFVGNNSKEHAHEFYALTSEQREQWFGIVHLIKAAPIGGDDGEDHQGASGKTIGIAVGCMVGFLLFCLLLAVQRKRCKRCCLSCFGCGDDTPDREELATVDLEKDLKAYHKIR